MGVMERASRYLAELECGPTVGLISRPAKFRLWRWRSMIKGSVCLSFS